MLQSFILSVLCILAVLGFVSLLFYSIKDTVSCPPYVLSVKNRENSIECELRELIFKNPKCEIIVIDLSSSDATAGIVKKLSRSYPQITLISADDYII